MLKITTLLYLTLLVSTCASKEQYKKKFGVHITSVRCTVPQPNIYNATSNCGLKSFRNGTQLTTITLNLPKPCNDVWAHLMSLYKFGGSAQYRPWLFDNDEDVCGFFNGKTKLSLWFTLLKAAMDYVSPGVVHKCPYVGVEGWKAVNAEDIIARAIPQVVPTGDYRVYLRFHTTDNVTVMEVIVGLHADAVNPLEAISMVSMGRK